ncbi:DUF805 domain-containing protein [Vagococcus sp. PNs007]|uniref:DUF805 domain-containing protein n=2 Tax=Vagococcus proximus TaxID=2991417 RepID=A0ABT5X0R0_9ENTE|nr:DUF805 domain-containing protein [Vagococcus proximus]
MEENIAKIKEASRLMVDNIFNFEGRTSRGNYWWAGVGLFGLAIIVGILDSVSHFLGNIGILILFVLSLALTVRRYHDVGKPWYYMVWQALFPPFGLYFLIKKGDESTNKYGEPDNN